VKTHRKYVYLQSLMVSHHARRWGIGRQLMDTVHQWARSQGAAEVRLETWEFPEGPQRFYEVMGYRTLRRTLVNELDK
ncbi:MAG: GNAT family N-acetyltransferase, partial [Bacillota bacterium]